MDIVEIIRRKVTALGEGSLTLGLSSVLGHIEAAVKHLQRGQQTFDESAFTDAIYRTNQAFEGGLKEAYKVLSRKDVTKIRPFDIENYMQKNEVLKPRVLNQFTRYRQEWRNPSAHDYTLEFDESEAFLAIVSICAFTNVLVDQISQHLAHETAAKAFRKDKEEFRRQIDLSGSSLIEKVIKLLKEFVATYEVSDDLKPLRENELLGALTGFFSSIAPEVKIEADVFLNSVSRSRVDLIITEGTGKVMIEVKARYMRGTADSGVVQLRRYMEASGIKTAILFIYDSWSKVVKRTDSKLPEHDTEVIIISPLHLDLN